LILEPPGHVYPEIKSAPLAVSCVAKLVLVRRFGRQDMSLTIGSLQRRLE